MIPKDSMRFRESPELRTIAEALKKAPAVMWRIFHIDLDRVGFLYEYTCDGTKKAAVCRKVTQPYWQLLDEAGKRWDWIIEVYGWHAEDKSVEWLQILIYHELRHIGFDGTLVEHTVEDFGDILKDFGIEWAADRDPLPDITKLPAKY
jgi:hypothetical protein